MVSQKRMIQLTKGFNNCTWCALARTLEIHESARGLSTITCDCMLELWLRMVKREEITPPPQQGTGYEGIEKALNVPRDIVRNTAHT